MIFAMENEVPPAVPWKPKRILKKYKKARSIVWKQFELQVAKMLQGNRVPLSGSNSRHDTSADVFWDYAHPAYGWLYVECKRDKHLSKRLQAEYEKLKEGKILFSYMDKKLPYLEQKVKDAEGDNRWLCVMSLDWLTAKSDVPLSILAQENAVYTGHFMSVTNLYEKTVKKAEKEGKSTTILLFRLHNRHHIILAAEYSNLARFKRLLTCLTKNLEQRKDKTFYQMMSRAERAYNESRSLQEGPKVNSEARVIYKGDETHLSR